MAMQLRIADYLAFKVNGRRTRAQLGSPVNGTSQAQSIFVVAI